MDDRIPGVVPTFHYNVEQVAWDHNVAMWPDGSNAAVVVARRRAGRSTWLATRVLKAVAEASPARIDVDVWVTHQDAVIRFVSTVLELNDYGVPTLTWTTTGHTGGTIEFGTQRSVVNVRCWPPNHLVASTASLIVFDNIDCAAPGSGPAWFISHTSPRFIATSSCPLVPDAFDLTKLADAISVPMNDPVTQYLFKVYHFTEGFGAAHAFFGLYDQTIAAEHSG
jgi:hypothetical protein